MTTQCLVCRTSTPGPSRLCSPDCAHEAGDQIRQVTSELQRARAHRAAATDELRDRALHAARLVLELASAQSATAHAAGTITPVAVPGCWRPLEHVFAAMELDVTELEARRLHGLSA